MNWKWRNSVFRWGIAVCLFGTAWGAIAQETATRWTPGLMVQYQRIRQTAVSPDGRWVAYTVTRPRMEGEHSDYLTHIWLASRDGRQQMQLTRGETSCTDPAFSPDGEYLAFLSKRGDRKKTQIWLLPLAGGEAFQLTAVKSDVRAFAWSPDGTRIAFTMRDPLTEQEEKDKKEKRDWRVLDHNFKYAHLYTVTVGEAGTKGGAVRRLTTGDFHVTEFDWSPDGRTIAFTHQKAPGLDYWPTSDLSAVPADSGAVTSLVAWPGSDSDPLYSPDGRWLAFVSDGGEVKWAFASDLYILSTKGGEPKKLAQTFDQHPHPLAWSSGSKFIYYVETQRTSQRLFRLPISGAPYQAVTTGDGTFGSFSLSRNGKTLAMVYETTDTPSEVYVSPAARFKPTRLSSVHAGYPRLRMGKTEVVTWTSKDGLPVEGLLTYPIDYDLDRLYPLILVIHGGPAGVYRQNFTGRGSVYPIQALAQEGYAVLRPNPRGSSGYGKAFRFANYNDWGFGDYDDLMAGISKVIGLNVAHPDSLCVMGWSYGGYMTSFIVTKSNRFKAASVGAGVTNLMSFTGTSDIPSFLPDYFGGEPWDRLETYMKHSAMFHVKGVNTPTLILHGEEDRRVPLSQGLEFYNALKRQNCPVEMVVYPRMPHGPREPKVVVDIGERIIAWFNTYLGRRHGKGPVVAK